MKRIALLVLLLFAFAACAASPVPPAEHTAPVTEPPAALDLDAFHEAFFAAEEAVAYFSGYAGNVYTEGTMTFEGERYDRCSLADSRAALRSMVEGYLAPDLLDVLMEKTVLNLPLYYEDADGLLWRFGGYVAQYSLDTCTRTVTDAVRQTDGSIAVTVAITCDEFSAPLAFTHTYTCITDETGTIRFTGDFPLPIELVLDMLRI